MSAFNEFLRNNPEWIFYISFTVPLAVLCVLVSVFDRRRKRNKAIRQAHKAGLITKRSERHPNLDRSNCMITNLKLNESMSKRKDVKEDYFDRINQFYESV